jgi:hypothetical protein
MSAGKRVTYPGNYSQNALGTFGSKDQYICANAEITRGATPPPSSIEECFNRFSKVKDLAEIFGVTLGSLTSIAGVSGFTYPTDLYTGITCSECNAVKDNTNLGNDWLGCLWGLPETPYSCTCPEIGDKFEAYLKHRLNIATFWNTPKDAPVKRKEFLDSLKYARKINITIAGDFKIRPSDVVELRISNLSGYPFATPGSVLNGMYWVLGVTHVLTNTGTHETALKLSQILRSTRVSGSGTTTTTNPQDSSWNSDLDLPNNPIDFDNPFAPPNGDVVWS